MKCGNRYDREKCVMTTMVMSSAIKSSDIGVSGKHKGNIQENKEEMQWVFLTTAKRRNSVEEQKLVRVDSKHQGSATCLQSDHELKAKYSEKWLNRHARNKESNLATKPFQLSSLKIVIIRHWNCPQTIITKSPAKDTAAKRKV